MRAPHLFISVFLMIAFGAGILSERLLLSKQRTFPLQSSGISTDRIKSSAAHASSTDKDAATLLSKKSGRNSDSWSEYNSESTQSPQETKVTIPHLPPSPVLPKDENERIQEELLSPLPSPSFGEKTTNSDGSTDESVTTEDGKHIWRHTDPKGRIRSEGWSDQDNRESIYKAYYQNGALRNFGWRRPDGADTFLGFLQDGTLEHRSDTLPNDVSHVTNLDDLGQPKEVMECYNGHCERVWPKD